MVVVVVSAHRAELCHRNASLETGWQTKHYISVKWSPVVSPCTCNSPVVSVSIKSKIISPYNHRYLQILRPGIAQFAIFYVGFYFGRFYGRMHGPILRFDSPIESEQMTSLVHQSAPPPARGLPFEHAAPLRPYATININFHEGNLTCPDVLEELEGKQFFSAENSGPS